MLKQQELSRDVMVDSLNSANLIFTSGNDIDSLEHERVLFILTYTYYESVSAY